MPGSRPQVHVPQHPHAGVPVARGGTVGGCCDDAGVAGRNKRRQQRRGARQRAPQVGRGRPDDHSAQGAEAAASGNGDGDRREAGWDATRSGARSGRGFYFQYAVGAWLTASVGSGLIRAVAVPEGFEDVSLEGLDDGPSWHVQAKSRGEASGLFPVHKAADHILDSWEKHAGRAELDSKLVVVFERGVKGETLPGGLATSAPTLAESLQEGSRLLSSLRSRCGNRGMLDEDADRLLETAAVVAVTLDEVTEETVACVGGIVDLPLSSLRAVADLLVQVVARASAENASPRYADRRRLDKTEILGEIQRWAEQFDVEALEAAIHDGVCELFAYGGETLDDGGRFYEGEATQPFHVASGLVVRRPDVIAEVLQGLEDRFAVVITGPSGVGKSAVLWTIPREMPGVVWLRVKQLAVGDVPVILRLARAYGVLSTVPVGFLVDSAGTGNFTGWERLRAEAAAVPGMLLVATARDEDLTVLGSLTECATVAVRLDERSAETIYGGLVDRGSTEAAHWREAYENSDGLTLEFTHLLTRGKRLREVIGDQVRRRVAEERYSELEVLALASTADRWSATVSTTDVAQVCGLSDFELRGALERLHSEHLLVERDGWIGGLHRLRSTAICEAVHAPPPPAMDDTIRRLIPVMPVSQLHRFIAAMLTDRPQVRGIISDAARGQALDSQRLAACIQGLRLADFRELAKTWNEIAHQHGVPVAARLVLFMFAMAGARPADVFDSEFQAAWEAIVAAPPMDSRDDLIAAVGHGTIAEIVASATDLGEATHLLAVLAGCGPELAASIAEAADAQSQLASALRDAPVNVLAGCLYAARGADPAVALALVEALGGESAMVSRIRADNPWIMVLDVRSAGGARVGYGRFLHVPDAMEGSPDEQAHNLGRTLLRCLPQIESVDIKAVLPGGRDLVVGGYPAGISQLQREYDRPAPAAAWARERTRSAAALIGTTDTARLAQALPLLDEAAELLHAWGTALVRRRTSPERDLDQRRATLDESGRNLLPRQCDTRSHDAADAAELEQTTPDLQDDLAATITSITGNVIPRLTDPSQHRLLVAHIADPVIDKHISGAINEPWRLIGIDGHPPSLDRLKADLDHLCTALGELSSNENEAAKMARAARAASDSRALQRAADTAQKSQKRRQQRRRAVIQSTCRATGLRTRVFDCEQTAAFMYEYRVSVDLDSLMDWYSAVDSLQSALCRNQGLGETYLLVPLRNNKPVPGLALTLINNLWPTPDADGLDRLPAAHPSELADAFERAHLALQSLSDISDLPDAQQNHPKVQAFAQNLVLEWETAHEWLRGLPEDPVTAALLDYLGELAARVQSEFDGTSTEPSYAAQITRATEEITDEFELYCHARCFAYEWEIDPQAAIERLTATND